MRRTLAKSARIAFMLVRPFDADDDMVVDRDLHVPAGLDQVAGQADVCWLEAWDRRSGGCGR